MPAGNVSLLHAGSIAIGGAAGEQLLELECTMGRAQHKCVALVGSGASHFFLLATLAAGLVMGTSQHLQVRMADGKFRTSQGLARNVRVEFAPGVMQVWDFFGCAIGNGCHTGPAVAAWDATCH